jgi:serine/threonine protein kinase
MDLAGVFGGRYAVGPTPVLGKGSYGQVVQTTCGHAIKFIPWANDENDRYKAQEIRALDDCRHPNVVTLLDSAFFKGDLYLVMECWTVTLAQRLQQAAMSLEQGNWVLLHILRGLAHMHACGYLHRDLKPANILLRNNAQDPKVCDLCLADFGHATVYPPRSEVVTMPTDPRQSALVFTRWYRPPEVALLLPYDESADVFSVGCIYVEVVRQTRGELPLALCHESASCYPLSGKYITDGEHMHTLCKVLGTPSPEERALWVAPANDKRTHAITRANLLEFVDDLPHYDALDLGFPAAQTRYVSWMLAYDPAARKSAAALRDIIGGV